jgi:hypothetical protein
MLLRSGDYPTFRLPTGAEVDQFATVAGARQSTGMVWTHERDGDSDPKLWPQRSGTTGAEGIIHLVQT